mmetsp:Transcript_7992/g.20491  ORF Transcript_7992/g.20491 Transcript_7992/m.20491 type:complete len:281 (-) Transcript_7992:1736-2578(-)
MQRSAVYACVHGAPRAAVLQVGRRAACGAAGRATSGPGPGPAVRRLHRVGDPGGLPLRQRLQPPEVPRKPLAQREHVGVLLPELNPERLEHVVRRDRRRLEADRPAALRVGRAHGVFEHLQRHPRRDRGSDHVGPLGVEAVGDVGVGVGGGRRGGAGGTRVGQRGADGLGARRLEPRRSRVGREAVQPEHGVQEGVVGPGAVDVPPVGRPDVVGVEDILPGSREAPAVLEAHRDEPGRPGRPEPPNDRRDKVCRHLLQVQSRAAGGGGRRRGGGVGATRE